MITAGGTELSDALWLVLIAASVIAAVIVALWLIARRRGDTQLALRGAFAIADVWLVLVLLWFPFAAYHALFSGTLPVPIISGETWPEFVNSAAQAAPSGPHVTDAYFETSTVEIAGTTASPRLILLCAHLAAGITFAAPAVAVHVIVRNTIRAVPFDASSARWTAISGIAIAIAGTAWGLLEEIASFLIADEAIGEHNYGFVPTVQLTIGIAPLAAGLLCAALATVFRHGARLQEDTEGLV